MVAGAVASPALDTRAELEPRTFGATLGCGALNLVHPSKTFYPGDSTYEYENAQFWSNTQILSPQCIFRPTSATEVAAAILTSRLTQAKFAVRGGAHMAIPGANSIDDGILLVSSNLTTLQISDDRKSVVVGPGHNWGQVYKYLEQYNVAVAGGRLAPVGVPGLLLGGGVSFYGNQAGWSADNVLEYEVVLASGQIVTASATSNTDLFWALKGGSSNFGIVTSFKLRTFPSKKVFAGAYTVAGEYVEDFLAAVANFSAFNTDPKSHIVPMVVPSDATNSVGSAVLFYDSETDSNPECFAPFFAIPSIASTMGFKTVSDFAIEVGGLVVEDINDMFFTGSAVGKDYDTLYQGVKISHDVFIAALPELFAAVPVEDFVLLSVNWQPIGKLWSDGSKAMNPTGNALGIDVASKGTYLAWAGAVEWKSSKYDAAVNAWVQKTTAAINAAAKVAGIYEAFNYMGDASGFQKIYEGYGATNQKKLLDISRKYDPLRALQRLLPGGYKIGI
ncbi:FAD binding domain-containing protein [Plectosphaerella plurivora]|uniref:FAD binding domain-containing protein n=1 Tax=Plectosphaerella plurivora TaxID=936078 RepID=A0A9P8VDH4_9PEZI|nr:FAD binding domain-containing protein [Plectosphaerella plurivora]